MTTKTKSAKKTVPAATEKARKQAVAEIQKRIDAPEVASPAVDPTAQQVASIDVNPKAEIAAAKAHAAKGKKGAKAAKPAKEKKAKAAKPPKTKKVSGLDAAAQVLAKSGRPMNAKDIVTAMAEQKLWKSPGGKTPHATIYAAILREIGAKGKDARFRKMDRGMFAAAKGA